MISGLLISSIVIILSVLGLKLSQKIGVPSLLLFIGLGVFFGSDGIVQIPFDNYSLVESICTTALVFIMFYGGFGTRWETAKPIAVKALMLSTLGVVFTAILVGVFCRVILGIKTIESFLIGAVVSSTDAASVFSILKSKKLALKHQTAPLLEVESGSNDPAAYMLTLIALELMQGSATASQYLIMIGLQFGVGIFFALLLSKVTLYIYDNFNLKSDGLEIVFFVGMVLLSFSLPAIIGGNGYLSTYIFGILVGNHTLANKRVLIHFFDGITGLMQILVFFLLGLLAFPSQAADIVGIAIGVTLFLTLIARPLSVFITLKPLGCGWRQIFLVAFAGIRGASAIVFSIVATVSPTYIKYDIFHIVFCVVLFSIALQGTLLPLVARKLNMIDFEGNVLKTFTDYQEDDAVQLIRLTVPKTHPWAGSKLNTLELPPQLLIVAVLRNERQIIPDGNTIIKADDDLVIIAPSYSDENRLSLSEVKSNNWTGKQVRALKLPTRQLIALIKKGDDLIVPNGETFIDKDDVLVMLKNLK